MRVNLGNSTIIYMFLNYYFIKIEKVILEYLQLFESHVLLYVHIFVPSVLRMRNLPGSQSFTEEESNKMSNDSAGCFHKHPHVTHTFITSTLVICSPHQHV